MDKQFTQEFLAGGFRVFRKAPWAISTSLVAAIAFGAMTQVGQKHATFARNVPQDHAASAPQLENPFGIDTVQQVLTARAIKHEGEATSPDGTVFAFADHAGINAMANEVANRAQGKGFLLPTDLRERMDVPRYRMTDEIRDAIRYASKVTGVRQSILYAFASKESNFRPRVGAGTSSAQGMFQHVDDTWTRVVKKLGPFYGYRSEASHIRISNNRAYYTSNKAARHILRMRNNPRHAAVLTAALLIDDRDRVESQIGRPLEPREYYLTHFLGSNKAPIFLRALDRSPNARVDRVAELHDAIRANRNVFVDKRTGRYKSFAQVMDWVDREMGKRMAYFALKYGEPEEREEAIRYAASLGVLDEHIGEDFQFAGEGVEPPKKPAYEEVEVRTAALRP